MAENISFDDWAEWYDTEPEVDALRSHLDFSNKTVLEVGAGTGRLTKRLENRADRYTIVEPHRRRLETAITHTTGTIEGIQAVGEQLPVHSDQYDIVLDGWALSAQDVQTTLTEYKRALNSDGTIAIITEAWDEKERENSDYVSILKKHSPRDWPSLPESLWNPIESHLSNTTSVSLTSGYEFPSQQAALAAFQYHIESYNDHKLTDEQRDALRDDLATHQCQSGEVTLTEHARLYIGN